MRLCILLGLIAYTLASPNGYYHQEYNYKTSSSSYKNNELQHHNDDEGFYSKDGDLEGRLQPKVNAHSQHSEYVNPKLRQGYSREQMNSYGQLNAQNRFLMGNEGAMGAMGAQGAMGAMGAMGAQGAMGAMGAQGAMGAMGAQSAMGAMGARGAMGEMGYAQSQHHETHSNYQTYGVNSDLRDITQNIQNDLARQLQEAVFEKATAYTTTVSQAQALADQHALEEEIRRNVTMRLQDALKSHYGSQGIRGAYSYSIQDGRLQPTANYHNQELADLTRSIENNLIRQLEQQIQRQYQTVHHETRQTHHHQQQQVFGEDFRPQPQIYPRPKEEFRPQPQMYPSPIQQRPVYQYPQEVQVINHGESITTLATRVQNNLNEHLNRILDDTQKRYFSEGSFQHNANLDAILAQLQQELRANISLQFDDEIRRTYGYGYANTKYSTEDLENLRRQMESNLITKLNRDFNKQRERYFETYAASSSQMYANYQQQPINNQIYYAPQYQEDTAVIQRQLQERMSRQLQAALMRQQFRNSHGYNGGINPEANYQATLQQLTAELNRNLTRQLEQYHHGSGSQMAMLRNQLQNNLMQQLQQGLQQTYSRYSSWSSSSSFNNRPVREFNSGLYKSYGTNSELTGEDCMMGDDPKSDTRTKRAIKYEPTQTAEEQAQKLMDADGLTQQVQTNDDLVQKPQKIEDLTQQVQTNDGLTQQLEDTSDLTQQNIDDLQKLEPSAELNQKPQNKLLERKPVGQAIDQNQLAHPEQGLTQQVQGLGQEIEAEGGLPKPTLRPTPASGYSGQPSQSPHYTYNVNRQPMRYVPYSQTSYAGAPNGLVSRRVQQFERQQQPVYVYYTPTNQNIAAPQSSSYLTSPRNPQTSSYVWDPVTKQLVEERPQLTNYGSGLQTQQVLQPVYTSSYSRPQSVVTQQNPDFGLGQQTDSVGSYPRRHHHYYGGYRRHHGLGHQVDNSYVNQPNQNLGEGGYRRFPNQAATGYNPDLTQQTQNVGGYRRFPSQTNTGLGQQVDNSDLTQQTVEVNPLLGQQNVDNSGLTQQTQNVRQVDPSDFAQQNQNLTHQNVQVNPLLGQQSIDDSDLTQQSQDLTHQELQVNPLLGQQQVEDLPQQNQDLTHQQYQVKPLSNIQLGQQTENLGQQTLDDSDLTQQTQDFGYKPLQNKPYSQLGQQVEDLTLGQQVDDSDLTQQTQDLTQQAEDLNPKPYQPKTWAQIVSGGQRVEDIPQSLDLQQQPTDLTQQQTEDFSYSKPQQKPKLGQQIEDLGQQVDNSDLTQQTQDLTQQVDNDDLTQQTQDINPKPYQPKTWAQIESEGQRVEDIPQSLDLQQPTDLTQQQTEDFGYNKPQQKPKLGQQIEDLVQQVDNSDLTQQTQQVDNDDITQQTEDLNPKPYQPKTWAQIESEGQRVEDIPPSQDLVQQPTDLTQQVVEGTESYPQIPSAELTTNQINKNKRQPTSQDFIQQEINDPQQSQSQTIPNQDLENAQKQSDQLISLLQNKVNQNQQQPYSNFDYKPQPVYQNYNGHDIQIGTTRNFPQAQNSQPIEQEPQVEQISDQSLVDPNPNNQQYASPYGKKLNYGNQQELEQNLETLDDLAQQPVEPQQADEIEQVTALNPADIQEIKGLEPVAVPQEAVDGTTVKPGFWKRVGNSVRDKANAIREKIG